MNRYQLSLSIQALSRELREEMAEERNGLFRNARNDIREDVIVRLEQILLKVRHQEVAR